MPDKRTAALAALMALCLIPGLRAQETGALPPEAHRRVMGLSGASAPEVFGDDVIYTSTLTARFVGIAFEHEDWKILHAMRKTPKGVFFAVLPIPPMMKDPIRYRLVADGVWCSDPANPDREADAATGLSVSVVRAPLVTDRKPGVFRLVAEDGRTVRFRFRGAPGETVTVAGTFNSWDPFMYELAETEPGLYALDLPLPEGEHRYAFVYRGVLVPDALNPDSSWTKEGGDRVSRIVIGGSGAGSPDGRVAVRK